MNMLCLIGFVLLCTAYDGECRSAGITKRALCACGFDYLPVCGRNGKTYSNECSMRCERVKKAYGGKCRGRGRRSSEESTVTVVAEPAPEEVVAIEEEKTTDMCPCQKIYAPVCGSDGVTYDNVCEMACAEQDLAYEGECQEKICTADYNPVCGNDGVTYANACMMEGSEQDLAYEGECQERRRRAFGLGETLCTADYNPVCGNDGITYANACMMEGAEQDLAYEGECQEKICTADYNPVCGNDGVTYANACMMEGSASLAYEGECL